MFRSKPSIRTILAGVGVFAVSFVLTQCTGMSTPLPVQDVPANAVATRTAAATETKEVINDPPAEVEVATITPTVPTFSPTPDAPILEPGGPGAATNLQSEAECERPGESVARLSWSPAVGPGEAQRVDVTIFKDGFETGKFESSELLPPDQSALTWEELSTGLNHRWRVLTLKADSWVSSETAIFKGPICVGEEDEESIPTPVIQ